MYEKYAELRDKKGLSDYKVCQATGIAPSSMTDWKKGTYKPKIDKLLLLSSFFEVPLEYFISDTGRAE